MTNAAPDSNALARALSLHQAGRHAEAEAVYRAMIAQDPGRADARYLLVLLLTDTGRADEAAVEIAETIARAPSEALYHFTQGTIAMGRAEVDLAIAAFEAALARNPAFVEAATNLALVLARRGRTPEAEAMHRHAAALGPLNVTAQYNLGQFLHRRGDAKAAIAPYRAALKAAPAHLPSQLNLATALRQAGDTDAAETEYRRAIAIAPANGEGWLGLGLAQKDRGDLKTALASFDELLRRNPTSPEAHLNLSLALLSLGRFEEAWPHYEQRWNAPPLVNYRRSFNVPAWDGAALGSRRLLIHAEQGLGDLIQFVHLLPTLGAAPAQPDRRTALAAVAAAATVRALRHARSQRARRCRPSIAMRRCSTCRACSGSRSACIRPMTGILAADPARVARWRQRLAGPGRLIALVWRGGEANPENERRSIDPELLRPLFERTDLRFVSLQKGEAPPHPAVIDPARLAADDGFDPPGGAFLDSAAILSVADAVVTVDTALAHVAGALGRPGFVLLPHVCDWRWLTGRSDCLWYPSLRLLRQPTQGHWQPVASSGYCLR